ncbi:hypothetical protein [Timonella senegalensis]|uniref:hypothetical protein n=1 Tax=Timonella senegalensis TaxID=1465825 RepID=UPI002FE4165F
MGLAEIFDDRARLPARARVSVAGLSTIVPATHLSAPYRVVGWCWGVSRIVVNQGVKHTRTRHFCSILPEERLQSNKNGGFEA